MAEVKTINTRIVLRNDILSKWESSDKALLKGEAALALRPDGKYEIRFGAQDSLSSWSQLSSVGQLVIPAKNVEFLTYQEYQLSVLTPSEGEQTKFQLYGKKSTDGEWVAIGTSPITIPEVDFGPVNNKIEYLSNAVSTITETTLPNLKTELSGTLSSYTDTKATELIGTINTVSAETLVSAYADATSKANQALADAKTYTNTISTALSTDYQGQIDNIKKEMKDGIHFIGHVAAYGLTKDGETVVGGWYKLTASGNQIAAKNGDLIIYDNKEFIWSDSKKTWDEFGDEGNYATKQYVDDAKAAAISATENTVQQVSFLSDLTAGVNTGDVGIVKSEIGSTGKYEISAYTWDADLTSWVAMDAYYSADKVIMPTNMKITEKFGKYDIPSSGSRELACAGMTVKEFIKDAFSQTIPTTKTDPTAKLEASGGSGEVGTEYTVPGAKFTMTSVGTYTYDSDTGVTIPVLSATITRAYDGGTAQNTAALGKNGNFSLAATSTKVEYTDSKVDYSFTSVSRYTDGIVPHNNIGDEEADKQIKSAELTPSATASFQGYRCMFLGAVADNDAIDSAKIRSLVNMGQVGSTTVELSKGSKYWGSTIDAKRIILAIPTKNKGVNVSTTLKSVLLKSASNTPITNFYVKQSSTVDVKGASSGSDAVAYNVWIYQPASIAANEVHTITIG